MFVSSASAERETHTHSLLLVNRSPPSTHLSLPFNTHTVCWKSRDRAQITDFRLMVIKLSERGPISEQKLAFFRFSNSKNFLKFKFFFNQATRTSSWSPVIFELIGCILDDDLSDEEGIRFNSYIHMYLVHWYLIQQQKKIPFSKHIVCDYQTM